MIWTQGTPPFPLKFVNCTRAILHRVNQRVLNLMCIYWRIFLFNLSFCKLRVWLRIVIPFWSLDLEWVRAGTHDGTWGSHGSQLFIVCSVRVTTLTEHTPNAVTVSRNTWAVNHDVPKLFFKIWKNGVQEWIPCLFLPLETKCFVEQFHWEHL